MSKGVNFFGAWETLDGIGRAASLNIACLEDAGVPLNKFILSRPVARQSGKDTVIDDQLIRSLSHRINIFQFSARWVPHYFAKLSDRALDGFYNIGYWVCETPKIPDSWAYQSEYFSEIWTASTFCQSAIAHSLKIPVIKIPHAIESRETTLRMTSRSSGAMFPTFTFLTIFNSYSDAERKNVLFAIRAFLKAHGDSPHVRLNVKASNLEHDPLLSEKLALIAATHQNIEIIPGYLGNDAIHALYEQADAYISLHRAEGFGLTISDAMSRGIPVITTGYSGNMEFCEASDTTLVAYELRSVGHERLRYRRDDIWAEPDMADTVRAFKEMVQDYPRKLRLAANARERIARRFSIEQIGSLMRERIDLINSNFSFTNDMSDRRLDREVGVYDTYGF